MKLLTFLLVFMVSILACSATVLDAASDLDTRSENSQLAKCRTSRDCVNFFKVCKKGVCQYRGNHARDETDPEPELEPDSAPEPVETTPKPDDEVKVDKLDVPSTCQKDADCGDGICLENVCVEAGEYLWYLSIRVKANVPMDVNDGKDLDDDDEMHILNPEVNVFKARKACKSDNDCPKGKTCLWNACRAPMKMPHSTRDDEMELNDNATEIDIEDDSQLLSKRDDAVLDLVVVNVEDVDDDDDVDDPEAHLFTRAKRCKTFKDCDAGYGCKNKRCFRRDCATRPTCPGRCKDGKCVRSLDLETDEDDSATGLSERGKHPAYCKAKKDCPPNFRCYGGFCKFHPTNPDKRDDEDITDSEIEARAVDGYRTCKSEKDCYGHMKCVNSKCRYEYTSDWYKRDEGVTIPEPDAEILGKYPPYCKSKDDCPPKYRCYGGICKYRG